MEKYIKEGCESIRKFMGVKDTIPHDHQGIYPYNSSLDWLASVYRKIDKMYTNLVRKHINLETPIPKEAVMMYGRIRNARMTEDTDDLFEKAVKFVKWYNSCQKKR